MFSTLTLAASEPATGAFTLEQLTPALLIGSLVLIVSVAAVRLSVSTGLPSLLLYLGIGLAIGEGGFGIEFDSAEVTQVLGYSALILILTEGGLTTQWTEIRRQVAPAALLSTLGVVVSVFVVGAGAYFLLGRSWTLALLIGAILTSTDAAAVFSVLRRVPLPPRITGVLEAESGFNDAPVVLLVTALALQAAEGEGEPWYTLLWHAAAELAGGSAIGLLIGFGGAWLAKRSPSSSSGLFAIGIVGLAVLSYAAADTVHASGFIAVYLAALVLGNQELPHRPATQGFATALGWLAQIGLFVLLGLLASPSGFLRQLVPALVIGLVLLLVARPLSVFVSMTPFRVPWRDQVFLSWAGLRGAVPVVLATVPLTVGTPGVDGIFDLVFVLVVIFTLVQGPTLPWLARRLGLAEGHTTLDLQVESTPLEEMHAELVQVSVGVDSRLHGVEVFELRLPVGANVTLVVRGGEGFVPQNTTVIRRGDQLLIVTTSRARGATERRVRMVSQGGRLAGWQGGAGTVLPSPRSPRRWRGGAADGTSSKGRV